MKSLQRFISVLFLGFLGLTIVSNRTHAATPPTFPPDITIDYVNIVGGPDLEAEAVGHLFYSSEQPELSIMFFHGTDIIPVPVISTVWSPVINQQRQWVILLDLSAVPTGIYQAQVTATLSDGTTISDMLRDPVPQCDGDTCTPGG